MNVERNLEGLTTAHLADACLQQGMEPRLAPQQLVPMVSGVHVTGRVVPVRHAGSVDILIEVISQAEPGCALVIDDNGRRDQACIGDLVMGEAKLAQLAGFSCGAVTETLKRFARSVFPCSP